MPAAAAHHRIRSASSPQRSLNWYSQSTTVTDLAHAPPAVPTTKWLWRTELANHVFRIERLAAKLLQFLRGIEVVHMMAVTPRLEIAARRVLGSRIPVTHLLGGSTGKQEVSSCWQLDAAGIVPEWKEMDPLPSGPRSLAATAPLGSRIYVVGGFNGSDFFDSVEVFVPERQRWEPGPKMLQRRAGLALATASGHLFACGGRDGPRYLKSVERLDLPSVTSEVQGSWQAMPDLKSLRCYAFARQFLGKVWVCGGMEPGNKYLASVEQLVIDGTEGSSSWQPGPAMLEPRAFACGGNLGFGLCICGGSGAHGPLSSAECISAPGERWQEMAPMSERRAFASGAIFAKPAAGGEFQGGKLMVFGGFNGLEYLSTVETFIEDEARWEEGPRLSGNLIWSAATAVESPLSMQRASSSSRTASGERSQLSSRENHGSRNLFPSGFVY